MAKGNSQSYAHFGFPDVIVQQSAPFHAKETRFAPIIERIDSAWVLTPTSLENLIVPMTDTWYHDRR